MINETELNAHRANAEAELELARLAMQDDNSEVFLAHLDRALAHLNALN
jgi:hypothetical protein